MGDDINETVQLQDCQDDEAYYARDLLLGRYYLHLNEDKMHWILNHIDCFVRQSRGNKNVLKLIFYPYSFDAFDGQDDEVWHKLGQAFGNLQALETLRIGNSHYRYDRLFAQAIQGHPTISGFTQCFEGGRRFPYEASDALYSALATLPALESISLSNCRHDEQLEDESALANAESLTELLRSPCLRSVCFDDFNFTFVFVKQQRTR
jgi:hypothetical protein